ncbi:hypothetical protein CFP56_031605 [Quercus suber]|uniref:Reverse transcriptase zinc-binding domain-containing protein n=1 Tax=Quercus suber TaxID=58331 RepID=A0AAW0JKE1_QUESU
MDPICHLCNRAEEDTHHALWGCEAIRRVWDRDFHWANQFEAAQGSFQDLVVLVMTKPRIREVFATTAWFIWSHRKKTRLQERTVPLSGIRESVSSFMQLYNSCCVHSNSCKMVRQINGNLQSQVLIKRILTALCLLKVRKLVWALWSETQMVWLWLRWQKK